MDAAVNKPGSSNEVFLFKGDKYVRYHVGQEKIMSAGHPPAGAVEAGDQGDEGGPERGLGALLLPEVDA
ncbi:hemopexin repeat-containing protein [Streptomyces sp. NPDC006261]|uniref:hemopexin repeat-containing protein n=1 Tax=Streptomyces sp. NPDC006261 TaxID=3156739 RepID=UPI0033B8C1C4